MAFTFIHTADVHLDSPLIGLSARAGTRSDLFVGASRRAFYNLVEAAIERCVSFVVIAGDLYDGTWKDYGTGLFFVEQMARLQRQNIPVFLLHGNHDAENRMLRRVTLPANVRVFSSRRCDTFDLTELGVSIHGRSFATGNVMENLAATYPPPTDRRFNIGVLHTACDGRAGHEPYAPCTVEQLATHGYSYWALGHVHRREVLHEDPWIVFPGNLQGRRFREDGAKGCTLVEVSDGAEVRIEHLVVDSARWSVVVTDVTNCDDFNSVIDRARASLAVAAADADGRPLAIRVDIQGGTRVHNELISDPERLAAECQAAALTVAEQIWVSDVRVQTSDPAATSLAARSDVVGQLARTLTDLCSDSELRSKLSEEIRSLLQKVPSEAGLDLSADNLEEILRDARQNAIAQVIKGASAS